jgi:hypothetical protein
MARIASFVLVAYFLLLTQATAQAPPATSGTVTERPASSRTALPPPASNLCLYEDAQFTVGAMKCISQKLWLVCQPADANHASTWWSSGESAYCQDMFKVISPPAAAEKKPARQAGPPSAAP